MMTRQIEDYALIGGARAAALVGCNGSIDWCCVPRFDSPACFAALLGRPEHGRWLLAPVDGPVASRRRYRDDSMVLETEFTAGDGAVMVTDCMPLDDGRTDIVRVVTGLAGAVRMRCDLGVRFDYGRVTPRVRHLDDGVLGVVAGPDAIEIRVPVATTITDGRVLAAFTVREGERLPFVFTWFPSHESPPPPIDADAALAATDRGWRRWVGAAACDGPWRDALVRSLITLKGLTYAPTGGIVAAPTTSLPEWIGGSRNWDYRYCWLRDATFTLYALLGSGYRDEAVAWRSWLLRAVAGQPADLQVLYGLRGERRLHEATIPWLPGYEGSTPVRVGNDAFGQLQIDVYGEVLDVFHLAREAGVEPEDAAWEVQRSLLDYLAEHWQDADRGIWEVRGRPRHFTHSKAMAWLAFDRGVRAVEAHGLDGPVERWRQLRDIIHAEVCARGYDAERGVFVQAYDSRELDASLLLLPLTGFLSHDDPRMLRTVEAIRRELTHDGFVRRYRPDPELDGQEDEEGVFLACSFWLVDNLALQGRHDEATALFERLLALANDVGLLAEEYDPVAGRMLGNFPQAFSHVALINSIHNLAERRGPARHRAGAATR